MNFDAIPQELRALPQWVCWRWEFKDGKRTKVPYNPHTGQRYRQPGDLTDFNTAVQAAGMPNWYAGIGFEFSDDGGLVGIDFDHCIQNGQLDPVVADWVQRLNSYTEISPSGTGLHIIYFGQLPGKSIKTDAVEMYDHGRFFTVTGNVCGQARPIRGAQIEGDKLYAAIAATRQQGNQTTGVPTEPLQSVVHLDDNEVLRIAFHAKNGEKIRTQWGGDTSAYGNDHSRADLALLNELAPYARDVEQLDRLFRQSGLMREKWDRPQSGSTWGALQCEKAFRERTWVFGSNSTPEQDFGTPFTVLPIDPAKYPPNDIGLGQWVADCLKGTARYCPQAAEWYVYDGSRWVLDTAGLRVAELVKYLSRKLLACIEPIKDDAMREAFLKYAGRLGRLRERQNLITSARSVYPIQITEFDRDPYLFNCVNGTLDLRTFTLHEHRPGDLITKQSPAIYDPAARCERWERFIMEIMSGDMEKARYFQTAVGYAVSGLYTEKCVFMLNGPKANNGKSVATGTILRLFGSYGEAAQASVVILSPHGQNSSGPTEDVARLRGARFVSIAEPDKASRINAGLVKQMSGAGDPLNARFLHQNSFEFIPTFKLFIHCNGLPRISDDAVFSSGRIRVIPFDRSFTEDEQDKTLNSLFALPANMSGILNWCIEGARIYAAQGLREPLAVQQATSRYRVDNDYFRQFLDEHFDPNGQGTTTVSTMRTVYGMWCSRNEVKPFSLKAFTDALESHGLAVRGVHKKQKGVSGKLYPDGVPYVLPSTETM